MCILQAIGGQAYTVPYLSAKAEALAWSGNPAHGFEVMAQAPGQPEEAGKRLYEAELLRTRVWLRLLGDALEPELAEASLLVAIQVAKKQSARLQELPSPASLAHLMQRQGRVDEALQLRRGISGWFSKGFGAPDLVEARAVLDELGQATSVDDLLAQSQYRHLILRDAGGEGRGIACHGPRSETLVSVAAWLVRRNASLRF